MDWKEIYEQKKNGTYTPAATTKSSSTSSTESSSGGNDWRSIYEQKKKAKETDVKSWSSAVNALISDYNTGSSMWAKDGEGFNSYLSERERLLTYADNFKKQYSGNQEALKYIDEVVSVLDSTPTKLIKTWDDLWRDKYEGSSHDDLVKTLDTLEEDSDERKWLEEYSWSDDVMTVDDYQKLIYQTEKNLDFWKKNNAVDGYATAHDEQLNQHYIYEDEIAEAEAELERLNAGKWRVENKEKYGRLANTSDFKAKSSPDLDKYGKLGNYTYHYINDENVQKTASAQAMRAGANTAEERKGYNLMTDEEVEMYNYLYHVSGKKAAQEYLDYLEYELTGRRAQNVSEVSAEFAKENPGWASVASVPANLMSGIGYLDVAGQNVVKNIKEAVTGEYAGPINYNSSAMTPSATSTSIRKTVAENLTNKYGAIELDENEHPVLSRIFNGKSLGDVYQLGMSMVDSGATYLLAPVIGSAGTALLAGSAATQGMLDAVANGATDGQALTVGFVNGVAEWGFEKIGFDNFMNKIIKGDKAGIIAVLGSLVSQGLAEGGEELGTSFVNTVADHLIMAEKSGYSRAVQAYIDEGLTPEEAATKALQDIAISMGWDFVGGMLSGGIMGGGASTIKGGIQAVGSGIQNINDRSEAKRLYGPQAAELANEVLELNPDNKTAQKVQTKLADGKKASGGQLLNLVNQRDQGAIANAAEARLVDLGETGDVKAISSVLAKQAVGEKLSKAEQKTLSQSKYGSRVANELNPENVRSGNYTAEWVKDIGTKRVNAAEYNRVAEAAQSSTGQVKAAQQESTAPATNNLTVTPNNSTGEETPGSIEEASKKYGAQAGAMLHTYHKGQDVAKFDAAYNVAFMVGEENGNLDAIKKSPATAYLSETQIENAYNAGRDSVALEQANTISEEHTGTEGKALVQEIVSEMGISAEDADALVSKYDPSTSAEVYAEGIQEAFRYGKYGTVESMEADEAVTKALTAEQREAAFELGQKAKENKVKAQAAAVNEVYEKAKAKLSEGKGKKKEFGKVVFRDKIKEKSLTKAQKTVVDVAKVISAALGVDVYIYSGMTEYGKYDKGTRTVWLNVNANISGQTLMLTTLAHEVVHHAKEISPEKFQALADFLISEYGKKGLSIVEMIAAKQQEYAEDGIELDEDDAYEEVIAEAMSNMLTDSNAVERLAELNKEHPDLVTWIKNFLKDLLERIQTLFGQLPAESPEAQLVREMEQETQKVLQNLFADMLVDAGEHYSTIRQAFGKNTTIETNAEGEFLLATNNGGSESPAKFMFNAATWENGGRDTLETALRREGFSAKDVKAALTIMDAKYELVKQLGKEYTEQGRINQIKVSTDIKDGKSVVSALVTNGDYPVNIDLLMVCKKRQAYQKVINRLCETGMIQKATVDSLAIAEINKILGKYGFETACLGCFVESRRLRVQEWAETICKEWNAEVKKRNPNAKAFGFGEGEATLTQEEVMQLVSELESGGEKNDKGNLNLGQGSAVKRMGVLMDKVPSLQKTLTVEDLITPEGLTALRRYDSNLFSMVKSRYGSNSPKYVQDFNPYNSELANYGKVPSEYKSLREYLYAIGGARMQSFSDFIVENWFDYTQIVADLAARKLPMHTYTKEISLAKLFGMTGIKINMSLIPGIDRSLDKEYAGLTLNENGEYELIWADKDRHKATGGKSYMQSINFADAIALQEDPRYSANVGTIAVGISDNHILKMLDDPRIRMIIPYHSSGMNPIYADMVGSSYYKDYTMTQNTSVAYLINSKGKQVSLKLTKEQAKKLTAGFEFNKTLQELGDARATAEAYKAWCKDASKHTITIGGENYTAVLTPKFEEFAWHENYYKLLEDFNTYDCITEQAAPQGDVTQTYPDAFEDILREEVQAREDYRQVQEPKFDDAMAEIESFLETHSKADSVHYSEQRGIKLGTKDKKLNAAEKAKLADLRAKDKSMYRMPPKTERDSEYLEAVNRGDMKKAQQMVDEAAKAAGYVIEGWHGTKGGKFTQFKFGSYGIYLTSDKKIAETYGKDVMHLYGTANNQLTIDAQGASYYNIPVPEWLRKEMDRYPFLRGPADTDSIATVAKRLGYSSVRIANVNDPDSFATGYSSVSDDYIYFESLDKLHFKNSQVKSADSVTYDDNGDVIPLSERFNETKPDIRYRMPSKNKYSYESLVSKPDMKVVTLDSNVPDNRADVVYYAKQNAAAVGRFDIKSGNPFVYVDDTGTEVMLSTKGLRHGLDRRFGVNAPATLKAGEIIKNAIRINELTPDKDTIDASYVLVGAAKNENDEPYIVQFVVNRATNEVTSVDVLYSVNAKTEGVKAIKKEPTGSLSPEIAAKPATLTDSTISIAELLEYVNEYFPDVLPEEVLKHFGHDRRPEGKLGESALYRQGSEATLNTRQLLANAFESIAQNDIERDKIKEYREKIDLINAQEQKLRELRAEIKELSFSQGPRDTAKLETLQKEATKTANRIDVYDKQLLRLEASKPLQAVLEREKAKARKKAEQKGREALAAHRARASRTTMRHKIKGVVNELNSYLLKGSKDKHVMIGLQKAVASALDVVNMDTIGAEERIAKLEAELMKAKTPEAIMEITRKIDNVRAMGDKMSEKLAKLKAAYAEIKDSDDPLIANSHDEVIEATIETVAKKVGETPLRDMSMEQLEEVYDLYKMVLTKVRDANKSFKADKKRSIDSLASSVQEEVETVGGKKKHYKIFEGVSGFLWNNFKPVYAFKAIGSKTLSRLFNNVRAGEDVWAKDVSEARAFYLEQSKKYGYDSWDMEKPYSFKSTTGMDFKLNLEQIMSLYAYSKRKQAEDHLKYGGIVFESSFETKKFFGKFDINLKTEDATAYNISPETMKEITAVLESVPGAKDFVDAMQDYLSTTMGEKGNEVSLEMYGVKLFKEKFYFPLKSAPQYMAKAREQAKGEVKIKNSGFTKETSPHAKNPIVLESFMDVWANHVNDMSMYHAFTLPLEDFYRVYNYKTPNTNEKMPAEGVNPAIENAYGKGATNYIEQLLRDLNGGARNDPTAGFINKMMGKFKKGAVFASASVVVQQPSAVTRALSLVDAKYFRGEKIDAKRHKALWEEVKQYAPIAIIKEMGYFDTNTGKSTVDFIKAAEHKSLVDVLRDRDVASAKKNIKDLALDADYRDEVLSRAPALADELAWCQIWMAVKRETASRHTSLETSSKEFLELAGARFTQIVTETQVYDSVLSRSAMMRSKDSGVKMATAFMAEPTTAINMLADAIIQGKRGNKAYAGKVIGSVVAAQIINSALAAIVYAGRDDDEDETYWEKYIGSFVGGTIDSLNPLTYIPFVKDIISIIQGYDVERSDMAIVADVWKAFDQLDSDRVSGWRKVEDLVGNVAQIFGLPIKNIMRDARGLYQTFDSFLNGESFTAAGLGYAVKGAITGKDVSNAYQLLEARLRGDKAHEERVMARFKDEKSANSAVRTLIKENFADGDLNEEAAIELLVSYAGMEENDAYWKVQEWLSKAEGEGNEEDDGFSRYDKAYDAMLNGDSIKEAVAELTSHGYKEKDIISQLKSQVGTWYREGEITKQQAVQMLTKYADMDSEEITKTVNKWSTKVVTGIAYDDIKDEYLTGNITTTRAIEMRMKYGGESKDEAQETVDGWAFEKKHGFAYEDRGEAYISGEITATELRNIIMEQKGVSAVEADAQIEVFDWEADGHEHVTAERISAYHEHCEALGVPKDIYLEIRYIEGKTENDKDENGKTIYYTAMQKIMDVIDSYPLTSAQKTAVAKSIGWSDKNIRKYKLW